MNRYSRYTSRQTSLPAFMPSPNMYWPGGSLENWNALAQKDFQKNPWNYSQDYLYGGQGPNLTEQYMNSKNWLGISKKNNPFSKGNLGTGSKDNNSNSGGGNPSAYGFLSAIPETEIKAAGRIMKRGLWDLADPLYFLGSDKHHNAVGEGFSDAGVQMFKSSAQSGNAWGMLAGGITKGLGSLINAGWGGVDEEQKAKNDQANAYYGSYKSNARTYDDLTPILSQEEYKDAYYGGWFRPGWAERHNREDRQYYNNTKAGAYARRSNNVKSIDFENDMMARRNAIAFGGPLDTMNNDNMGAIGFNFMSDYLTMKNNQNSKNNNNNTQIPTFFSEGGSIEIKHPGRLTELKKRTGKTEAELWAEGKPDVRKMITFARNSRKWKKALGGYLDAKEKLLAFGGNLGTNSTDWSTGLIHVDEGQSHELNPLGGVPMGMDSNNVPNLVEEGEVIYNDYVYSNRLFVDQATKQKFHIGKKKEITYADLAKKLEKEILERPNDPLSKAGFKAQMQTLEENQERQKQEMEAERARQAFESLPPEEQVSMMNRANQEEQMAQQAIQEQAINQPSPEEVAMAQGVSPEEIAMAEEQNAQEIPEEQSMAYGGNLYAPGGTLNLTDEDISLIRRLFGNNRFTDNFEKTSAFLADPIDYMFGDDVEAAVDKLASLSQPQLEKFFNTSVGQKVAELIDASSTSKAQEAGVQRWAKATGRLQKPVQRAVVTAAKRALAQSKQVARGQMKTAPKGTSKPMNVTQSEVNAAQQAIRGGSNIPAGYSTNVGPATVSTVGSGTRVPLNNAYTGQVASRPTPADWGSRLAGTMEMEMPSTTPASSFVDRYAGAVGLTGVGTGVAGLGTLAYLAAQDQQDQPNQPEQQSPTVEEPANTSSNKALAWLNKNHPDIKDKGAIAVFLNKIAQENIASGRAERFAYRDAYDRLIHGDSLGTGSRGYHYTGNNAAAKQHYDWLRKLGMADWKAFELAFPEVPKDADRYGEGNYNKQNSAREQLRKELVASASTEDVTTANTSANTKKVYKALDGNRYSTRAAAINANKKYLKEHPNSQKQEDFVMTESELEGTQPEATAQNSAQAAPQASSDKSATSTSAGPATTSVSSPVASAATEAAAPTTVTEPSGVTTTGGYTVNGVTYPTEEEAIQASNDYATSLYNNIMNGNVGTQPDASEVVEEEWAKENPMIVAPSDNVPTAAWIPEWVPEEQKKDWSALTTPTATATTAARVGKTKDTYTNGTLTPSPKDHWMRYAGLFGPAVGLGMMAAGVGKPDYSRLDAALASLGEPVKADYKPIGNYLTYNPMDIWYEQNRLNANARATDRAIMNNAAPVGTKMAGLLANGYNNQIASGNLYRQALEYNDNQKARVTDFNRGTNMYNAKAFTDNSQFNATADNAFAQARAKLGLAAAEQILDSEAGWYNSLYKNINNSFKGMSDLGRDKTEKAWLKWLVDRNAFGNLGNKAEGGKIKKKRKSGLTY